MIFCGSEKTKYNPFFYMTPPATSYILCKGQVLIHTQWAPTKPADSIDGFYNRTEALIVFQADLWKRS